MPRRGDIVTEPEKKGKVIGVYTGVRRTGHDYFTFGMDRQRAYLPKEPNTGFYKISVLIIVPVEFT